jgi:membrane protease subunit (stomatin/prohibitin family)
MQKLVGNMDFFNRNDILDFFKGLYLTKVGDIISSYLVHSNISLLEVNAYLNEISAFALEEMSGIFDEYGVKLVSFYINNVNVPESDPVLVELKAALAKKTAMELVGYSYQQERSFDTMEGAANNPNSMSSGFMGAGLGLGMGAGLGGMMGTQFGDIAKVLNIEELKTCPSCNGKIGKFEKFCHLCGADTTSTEAKAPVVAESDASDK